MDGETVIDSKQLSLDDLIYSIYHLKTHYPSIYANVMENLLQRGWIEVDLAARLKHNERFKTLVEGKSINPYTGKMKQSYEVAQSMRKKKSTSAKKRKICKIKNK